MSQEETRIPVTVLTGFLGSGKTTLLNHLLETNPDTRYAIIENEFGAQGIDNELVIRPDETIVELNNGCLCCTLNDNLYDILNELHARRDEFDEIIIEATGVADPAGLCQPFIAHPLVKRHFPLTAIICLVDAELIEDQLEDTAEAMSQVTFSDILLINKTDLVTEKYITALQSKLKQFNPLATILTGNKSQFPNIEYHRNNSGLEEVFQRLKLTVDSTSFPVKKPHHHHHHDHTNEVNSITITLDQPLSLDKLRLQLTVFLTFQSEGLYRIKGLVWLNGEDEQFVLQSVGKRFDLTMKRPWKPDEERQSILVFIGKNMQRPGLERLLNNCLAGTA